METSLPSPFSARVHLLIYQRVAFKWKSLGSYGEDSEDDMGYVMNQ